MELGRNNLIKRFGESWQSSNSQNQKKQEIKKTHTWDELKDEF